MFMKRETIANKGIWTAKKRYILNAWDIEGVRFEKPKLKMMGIEAVKSSTPGACRTKIKEALEIMMSGTEDDLQKFVSNFRQQFEKMPLEDIAFPRGCNNIAKNSSPHSIYGKSCPIHVRGALLYNHYVKKHKLTHQTVLMRTLSLSSKLFRRSLDLTNRWITNYNFKRVSSTHSRQSLIRWVGTTNRKQPWSFYSDDIIFFRRYCTGVRQ
jgi:hypothetical protein